MTPSGGGFPETAAECVRIPVQPPTLPAWGPHKSSLQM